MPYVIFCQAHNALQVAPAGGLHNGPLVTNLERATKLLHITPALLQSSDGRCSRQGRYNEYTRGELMGLIDWLVVFAGRSRQKAREDTTEARRLRASKLVRHHQGRERPDLSPSLETAGHWQRYAASTPHRTPQ